MKVKFLNPAGQIQAWVVAIIVAAIPAVVALLKSAGF